MALSKQTLDHLCDAESHIRAAIKSAAVNEKPLVVKQLSEILMSMDQTKKFDEIMDMLDNRESGSSGQYGSFFNDEDE
jgi:hypothetical protein|tara:strand:+ start:1212 stop:1445 length:234 start_codon:yes stop_codon:yes gene_type:complete